MTAANRQATELDRLRAAYLALCRHLQAAHGIDWPTGSRAHLDAAHMRAHACQGTPWHATGANPTLDHHDEDRHEEQEL